MPTYCTGLNSHPISLLRSIFEVYDTEATLGIWDRTIGNYVEARLH